MSFVNLYQCIYIGICMSLIRGKLGQHEAGAKKERTDPIN